MSNAIPPKLSQKNLCKLHTKEPDLHIKSTKAYPRTAPGAHRVFKVQKIRGMGKAYTRWYKATKRHSP